MATGEGPRVPRFLPAYPPWYVRSAGAILVAVVAGAWLAATMLHVPQSVAARFTIVSLPGAATVAAPLVAELRVPERAYARLHPGMRVRLTFDALASDRNADRDGTLLRLDDAVHDGWFIAWVALDEDRWLSAAGGRPLVPGLAGTADIVTGRMRLIDTVGGPWRANP